MESHQQNSAVVELSQVTPVVLATADLARGRIFSWDRARRILRSNAPFTATVFGIVLLASILAAFAMKDTYQPIARVEVDPPNTGIKTLHEIEFANEIDNQDYLETQAQVLKSDALAVAVIRALHLDRDPELISKSDVEKYGNVAADSSASSAQSKSEDSSMQSQASLADRTPLESIAVEKFQRRLGVSPVRNSRLIEVSYTSKDPATAQKITNALITQFIDQNYRNRYSTTMEASEWLSRQLNDLHEKVQEANQAVADYQQKYGFVEADDRDVPMAQLMDNMNRQFSDASASRIEAEAYVRMIDLGESDGIPALRDDQVYQGLITRFADAKTRLAEARTVYGDDNSNVKRVENEVSELGTQVEAERARVVNQVRTVYAASLEREKLLQKTREHLRGQMGDAGSHMVGYKILKNEALATGELYNTLQSRLEEAGIYAGLRSSNIRVVDLAPKLMKPTAPNRTLIVGMGSIFGCFFALALCFVKDSLDSTVRSPDEIKENTGLHLLAMIPNVASGSSASMNRLSGGNGRTAQPWMLFDSMHSAEAEAIRDLRTGLTLRSESTPRVFLVTSPAAGEGKTTVAANLATSLALRGKTCLLDADLRRPKVSISFGVRPKAGLADVLSGKSSADGAIVQAPRSPALSLLCGNGEPSNPGDLVASDAMRDLITTLRGHYEFVVIDSPPVIPVSDARILSPLVDGVVVVGRYGSTTHRSLARATQLLRDVGGSVLGVVLNAIDYSSADYRYFNYGSNHSGSSNLYSLSPNGRMADHNSSNEPPKSRGAHA